ncbi:MAG: hypothetical protein HND57_11245 [Planctomycetes bacterium]|nr:hypothetical protein [Planctomycetota bacterium]
MRLDCPRSLTAETQSIWNFNGPSSNGLRLPMIWQGWQQDRRRRLD